MYRCTHIYIYEGDGRNHRGVPEPQSEFVAERDPLLFDQYLRFELSHSGSDNTTTVSSKPYTSGEKPSPMTGA